MISEQLKAWNVGAFEEEGSVGATVATEVISVSCVPTPLLYEKKRKESYGIDKILTGTYEDDTDDLHDVVPPESSDDWTAFADVKTAAYSSSHVPSKQVPVKADFNDGCQNFRAQLKVQIDNARQEFRAEFIAACDDFISQLKMQIDNVRRELRAEVNAVGEEFRTEVNAVGKERRAKVNPVRENVHAATDELGAITNTMVALKKDIAAMRCPQQQKYYRGNTGSKTAMDADPKNDSFAFTTRTNEKAPTVVFNDELRREIQSFKDEVSAMVKDELHSVKGGFKYVKAELSLQLTRQSLPYCLI
ncbi:uncharacterized protein LOC116132807 [Pistacia vera]|uniref:uncharacterized protein LOC116132807 n=1 Tax=Pistacia vera TaxID=55513 RepID=UPI001262D024|nr:uncharacterized protein LOC116132807 [Pistacia vera]